MELRLGRHTFGPDQALMMAIVNRTRDSFYDQGATYDDGPAQRAGATASSRRARRSSTSAASGRVRRAGRRGGGDPPRGRRSSRGCASSIPAWSSAWTPGARRWLARCARPAPTCSTTPGAGTTRGWSRWRRSSTPAIICTHTGGLPPRTDPYRIEYDDVVAVGDRGDDRAGRARPGGRRGPRVDRHRPGPRLRQEHLPLAGGHPPSRRDGRHGLAGPRLPVQQGLRRRDARRADSASA